MGSNLITITDRLKAMADEDYAVFQRRLVPSVPPERILGVRTPALRALARELTGTEQGEAFLAHLPHWYFEENNLHAFMVERIREYPAAMAAVEAFLPYVDNWATCDQFSPKALAKRLPELYGQIKRWLASGETYRVRFAIGMLMRHYLDGAFRPEALSMVAALRSEEYYVNMMRAWYFATALAKQYDAALPYLLEGRMDAWTHNKAIQKAVESDRIDGEAKAYLRLLKVKPGGSKAAGGE